VKIQQLEVLALKVQMDLVYGLMVIQQQMDHQVHVSDMQHVKV
jgi:hypothetical protein